MSGINLGIIGGGQLGSMLSEAASIAALIAPSSPIASVPTGIPFGI